jgi:hypothetical protein
MTVKEYLSGIADHLVHELEPILKINEVTRNSALLGSYTEAAVRRLIRRVVHPMRVSTGAVIDFPMPTSLQQGLAGGNVRYDATSEPGIPNVLILHDLNL